MRGRAAWLAAGVVYAGVTLGAGCDPTVVKATCVSLEPAEFNEAQHCHGPPVTPSGLSSCTDPLGVPADGEAVVCFVDGAGRVYSSYFPTTARVEGAGWTHSAYGSFASTLSPADETRCAAVLAVAPTVACP